MPIKVLITGVTGVIGNHLWTEFRKQPDVYDMYGLTRRLEPSDRIKSGELAEIPEDRWRVADVSDFGGVCRAVEGMDVVIHMAANPRPRSTLQELLPANIVGTHNVFEASRLAGVGRVICASSIWVSLGYQYDEPYNALAAGDFDALPDEMPIVAHDSELKPTSLYGCTKAWGEALGHYYADVHGMSVVCLRIGAFENAVDHTWPPMRASWISRRDMVQLVERCIHAPDTLRFEAFYGVSDNKYRFVDIDHARQVVGYEPMDNIENRVPMQ